MGSGRRRRRTRTRRAGRRRPRQLAMAVHERLASCRSLLMRESRTSIERSSLTLPQFDVVAELAGAGARGRTFVELSRRLLVTSGNLTGIVDRLTAVGLVRRVPDPHDRRAIRVALTVKGRRAARALVPRHAADVQVALSLIPRARLARLAGLLAELHDRLHARA